MWRKQEKGPLQISLRCTEEVHPDRPLQTNNRIKTTIVGPNMGKKNPKNNSDTWKCLPTFLMQPQLLEGKNNIIKTDKLKLEMIFKCLPKHKKNFFQMFNVWAFFNVLEIQMFNGNFECFCGSKAQQWWAIFGSHGWNIVQKNSYESHSIWIAVTVSVLL